MNVEDLAAVVHLYCAHVQKRKSKRYWVHPLLAVRSTNGQFTRFLLLSPTSFLQHYVHTHQKTNPTNRVSPELQKKTLRIQIQPFD